MNKRQRKKANKKIVVPIVDEFPLLFMTDEKKAAAYKDFEKFCQKYGRYFHYRDKWKVLHKMPRYAFFVEPNTELLKEVLQTIRPGRGLIKCVQKIDENERNKLQENG